MLQRDEARAAAKARSDELAAAKRAKFEEAEAASASLLAEKTAVAQKEREERERILQQEAERLQRWPASIPPRCMCSPLQWLLQPICFVLWSLLSTEARSEICFCAEIPLCRSEG